MSSQFKFKPDKIKYLSTIDTLDSSHRKIVNIINKKRDDVPKKEKKLLKLKNELKILDAKNSEIQNYINVRTKIIDEINQLTEEIEKIDNYEDELEYYEKTHEILFNYYDIIDGHKIVSTDNINNNSINNINQSNINLPISSTTSQNQQSNNKYDILISDIKIDNNLNSINEQSSEMFQDIENDKVINSENNDIKKKDDWDLDGIEIFKKSNELSKLDILNQMSKMKRKEKKTTKKRVKNVETLIRDSNNIFDYLEGKNITGENNTNKNATVETITTNVTDNKSSDVIVKETIKYDRASLFEDYKILLEGYPTQKKINKPCLNCGPTVNKVLIYSEGIYVCLICGQVENCIIENEITNYKDPMIEKPTFPYKRKNHFCEWIKLYCLNFIITAHKSRYQNIC